MVATPDAAVVQDIMACKDTSIQRLCNKDKAGSIIKPNGSAPRMGAEALNAELRGMVGPIGPLFFFFYCLVSFACTHTA